MKRPAAAAQQLDAFTGLVGSIQRRREKSPTRRTSHSPFPTQLRQPSLTFMTDTHVFGRVGCECWTEPTDTWVGPVKRTSSINLEHPLPWLPKCLVGRWHKAAAISMEPKEIRLFALVVGIRNVLFSVINRDDAIVGDLKDEIKRKLPNTITCDACRLQLFLATDGDQKAWYIPTLADENMLVKGEILPAIHALIREDKAVRDRSLVMEALDGMPEPTRKEFHLLVVVEESPRTLSFSNLKRTRFGDFFADRQSNRVKVRYQISNERAITNRGVKYFDMAGFPPVMHPSTGHKRIMEREVYEEIFKRMLEHATRCLEKKATGNLIVTGKEVVGKSRFYLYCVFHLVTKQVDIVNTLPPFRLVLNCLESFHMFDSNQKAFIKLLPEQVLELASQPDVLRLVDGDDDWTSSWLGVKVLFASTDAKSIKDRKKDCCRELIMPPWTWKELMEYNELLRDGYCDLVLPKDELEARFQTYGGTIRSIYAEQDLEMKEHLITQHLEHKDPLRLRPRY